MEGGCERRAGIDGVSDVQGHGGVFFDFASSCVLSIALEHRLGFAPPWFASALAAQCGGAEFDSAVVEVLALAHRGLEKRVGVRCAGGFGRQQVSPGLCFIDRGFSRFRCAIACIVQMECEGF